MCSLSFFQWQIVNAEDKFWSCFPFQLQTFSIWQVNFKSCCNIRFDSYCSFQQLLLLVFWRLSFVRICRAAYSRPYSISVSWRCDEATWDQQKPRASQGDKTSIPPWKLGLRTKNFHKIRSQHLNCDYITDLILAFKAGLGRREPNARSKRGALTGSVMMSSCSVNRVTTFLMKIF